LSCLDGFIARTNGEFDWLSHFANDEAIRAYGELIDRIQLFAGQNLQRFDSEMGKP
jgi:hypothetical protein